MDELEITVFDEIKDYKEKIYFFNFRQWFFAILIVVIVVPTYLLLKDKIGEDITSYIVIAIAGVLGFIGFVKIHELPAEKILPYWFRHYFLFAKPIKYITDEEYEKMHQKKVKTKVCKNNWNKKVKVSKNDLKKKKLEIKELKKKQKQEKLLEKAKKKYKIKEEKVKIKKEKQENKEKIINDKKQDELINKLSKLPKEQRDALLKLLEK